MGLDDSFSSDNLRVILLGKDIDLNGINFESISYRLSGRYGSSVGCCTGFYAEASERFLAQQRQRKLPFEVAVAVQEDRIQSGELEVEFGGNVHETHTKGKEHNTHQIS